MYLAQNYDVSILVFSELNLFWTENKELLSLNWNWINLYFDGLFYLNRMWIVVTLVIDELECKWNQNIYLYHKDYVSA